MYTSSQNRFRRDVVITPPENRRDQYTVRDPVNLKTFEFGEEEIYLCQAMDGTQATADILARFQAQFNMEISEEDFHAFADQIGEMGLLESVEEVRQRFRQDLKVTARQGSYTIKDPVTSKTYQLGEEEYFLCQSVERPASEVLQEFAQRFGLDLTEADFVNFAGQMASWGLLEPCPAPVPVEPELAESFLPFDPAAQRLRSDLVVTPTENKRTQRLSYMVKDPRTGRGFEFGEEEYFLCTALDGAMTASQIVAQFREHFEMDLAERDLVQFAQQLESLGLLEMPQAAVSEEEAAATELEEAEEIEAFEVTDEGLPLAYLPGQTRFRRDLVIAQGEKKKFAGIFYLVKDPDTDHSFEFAEQDYFLCQAMDGNATVEQILARFEGRFGMPLDEEDFARFTLQLTSLGLLEKADGSGMPTVAISEDEVWDEEPPDKIQWKWDHTESFFSTLAEILRPTFWFVKLNVYAMVPGVPIALWILFTHQITFAQDIQLAPFLISIAIHLFILNFTGKLFQGIIAAHYGAEVRDFYLRLRFNFVPRFHIDRSDVWHTFNRSQQLWTFSTPLVLRLVVFVWGMLVWLLAHGSGTSLATIAITVSYCGLIAFIYDGFPLRRHNDGNAWLTVWARLPHGWYTRLVRGGLLFMATFVKGQRSPEPLTWKEFLILGLGFADIFIIVFETKRHIGRFADGFNETFPNLFGPGTFYVLGAIFFVLIFIWWRNGFMKLREKEKKVAAKRGIKLDTAASEPQPITSWGFWKPKMIPIGIVVVVCIVLAWPIRYHAGGELTLLPPKQQPIQAPFTAKVVKVFHRGGDGTWLQPGVPLAQLESIDLENQIKTIKEQINSQAATLDKLLNTPRPEDVKVLQEQVELAQENVAGARQNVEVARKALETARYTAKLSATIERNTLALLKEGAVAQQQYDQAKGQADADQASMEGKASALASSSSNLRSTEQNLQQEQASLKQLQAGPYKQEITAARAELARLQQQLSYYLKQDANKTLTMPFYGTIITAHLDQLVGSYLNQGVTYATAQDDRNIWGEVLIPEYEIHEFKVGSKAEIKMWAYEKEPFHGQVVSIEPAAVLIQATPADPTTGRFVKVLVEIPNKEKLLKQNMSGYAKLESDYEPVIVAFSHPILRFILVEFWSWFP